MDGDALDAADVADVAIVGGGPAGLEAALVLGRALRSVRLFDAGPPRNVRATGIMGFVTRDGIAPSDFRATAHAELRRYGVAVEPRGVLAIDGEPGRFALRVEGLEAPVVARRVLLAVGMVDEAVPIPGAGSLWGHAIFQCPYCHGWEQRGRPWGVLATSVEVLEHATMFLAWTDRLTAFIGDLAVPDELARRLHRRGIHLERRPVERVVARGEALVGVVVAGETVACEALVARPPQHQTALVSSLGLELDAAGFVKVDARRRTSRPGVFAAGDLASGMQSAIGAAAAGQLAAAMILVELVA